MAFPHGIHSRNDAILLLEMFDGRRGGNLGDWDLDDFAHEKSDDPAVDLVRVRVRDELLPILLSKDEDRKHRATALMSELIAELRQT